MGSSESTGRSSEDEEEGHEEDNSPGGSRGSMGAGTAVAIAAASTAVVAAWGISRLVSSSRDSKSLPAITTWSPPPPGKLKMNTDGAPPRRDKGDDNVEPRRSRYAGILRNHSGEWVTTWSPPPPGRLKMNTDGAPPRRDKGDYNVEPRRSGYAGILRNHRGEWVGGFHGCIPETWTDTLTAELHGILKGLEYLEEHGYTESILESDCQAAVQWVKRQDRIRPQKRLREMVHKCRRLVRDNDIIVHLIKGVDGVDRNDIAMKSIKAEDGDDEKESIESGVINRCADRLARLAVKNRQKYEKIERLPDAIEDIYYEDRMAIVPASRDSW